MSSSSHAHPAPPPPPHDNSATYSNLARSSPSSSSSSTGLHSYGGSPASSSIVSPRLPSLHQYHHHDSIAKQQHAGGGSSTSSYGASPSSRFPAFAGPIRSSYRTATAASGNGTGLPSTASSSPSANTSRSSASNSGTHSHHSQHSLSSASSNGTGASHFQHPSSASYSAPSSKMYDGQIQQQQRYVNGQKRKLSPEAAPISPSHHRHTPSSSSSPHGHDRLAGLAAAAANGDTSGSSSSSSSKAASAAAAAQAKRIKTARACDGCRRKKIRCDVVDDGAPILGDPNNGNGGLTCAHCRQYGFECTFFLPITETRFKKKREREAEEMAAAAAAAAASAAASNRMHMGGGLGAGILPPPMHSSRSLSSMGSMLPFGASSGGPGGPPMSLPFRGLPGMSASMSSLGDGSGSNLNRGAHLDVPPVRISSTQEWPRPADQSRERSSPRSASDSSSSYAMLKHSGAGGAGVPSMHQTHTPVHHRHTPSDPPTNTDDVPPPADTRVLGPTSIAYIVHSTAFVPGAAIEEHDLKHHQTFEVGASGDGIIKFHKPPKATNAAPGDEGEGEDGAVDMSRVPELLRIRLAGDVAEKLVNTYFEKLGYLFPVISKSEFLHMSSPPPLMLYAICGVAALSREVPKEVLGSVKSALNGIFREIDVLSNSNANNVKAMLIMSLHSDVHGSTAVQAGSRCWNRVGAAVRMAQDLGLHRDASGRDDVDDDAYFLEQKRRVWGCCVTADRCMSISLGHPLAIDLTDCDVRLPSPHEILRYSTDVPAVPGADKPFAFNTEMLKLSILFGRVMKTIYSPTGLMKTTDEEIIGLLSDMDRWKEGLPTALRYRGAKESPAPAGILHISYACLLHLFFRVFMRISYNCPQHLTFSLTIERMTTLIRITRESIHWVDENDFYLDTLQFVSYGLVFCATVQYHAWIRRGDQEALTTLKRASDCVNRFARPGEQDAREDLSMRAKTGEVITMLHECAIGTYSNTPNSGNLNPTAGVTNRRWVDTVGGIVFKPDQTRPGGGVYVATKQNLMLDDLPQGTMIMAETEAGAVPALVRTSQDANGGWQTIAEHAKLNGGGDSGSGEDATPVNGPLTHVAGSVWLDADGRPVDRQGARLLTMIPVPGGDAMIQSYPGGPRLSFSAIANGIAPPNPTGNQQGDPSAQTAGGQTPLLSDAAWLAALNAQAAASAANANDDGRGDGGTNDDAEHATFNFSDLYTFDGQIAQPAAMMRNADGTTTTSGLGAASMYAFCGGGAQDQQQHHQQQISSIGAMGNSGDGVGGGGGGGGNGQQALDPLALDGMPGGPLDFAAWEQWFRGAAGGQPSAVAGHGGISGGGGGNNNAI